MTTDPIITWDLIRDACYIITALVLVGLVGKWLARAIERDQ